MKAIITFTDNKRYMDDSLKICIGEEVVVGIENVIADHMTPAQMLALKAFVTIKEAAKSVAKEDK